MSQEEGWAYTQISFLFTSSREAVGKRLKPQHGSRQECGTITHQDTSHRCGKCVTSTLILLTTSNTAPDSTRPPTEQQRTLHIYRKLVFYSIGTFNIISNLLCSFFMAGKNLSTLSINSSIGETECWWQRLKVLGLFWPASTSSGALGVFILWGPLSEVCLHVEYKWYDFVSFVTHKNARLSVSLEVRELSTQESQRKSEWMWN